MKDSLGSVQSVAVFGGASEIGVAIAAQLAGSRQAVVALLGRHRESLEAAAGRVSEAGASRVDVFDFDAEDTASHVGVVERTAAAVGDIDVAVVAFGLLGEQEADETGGDGAVRLALTNYVGVVSIGLTLARHMRRQGHGTIVVLSSVAGERVRRSNFIYGSSKAGADGFAQGLGDSLVGSGVRVVVVRPGFVHTKMTEGIKPPPLSTTPEAVAQATVAAIASGRETIWVPATFQPVMALIRHLPRVVFRRLPF